MFKNKPITVLIILGLVMCINISGCSGKSAEKKPESQQNQKPRAPQGMGIIRENIEKIISETAGKYKIIPLQADVRKQLDAEKKQSGGEEPISMWKKEEESLGKIHQNWNAMEPAAIKANLSERTRIEYENALDQLTINIGKQLPEASLLAAIKLYEKYADITDVFDTPIPAEFFRVKYNVMMATVEAVRNNWQQADQHIVVAQEKWDNLQVQAKKSDQKSSDCSKFSINDLHSAIKTGQIDLVMAKSSIVLKNLQKLEDKL